MHMRARIRTNADKHSVLTASKSGDKSTQRSRSLSTHYSNDKDMLIKF